MLAYLTTDAQISPAVLRKLMQQAADVSFNNVTVDDQASTNDTCCLLASGASGVKIAERAQREELFGGARGGLPEPRLPDRRRRRRRDQGHRGHRAAMP